MTGERWQLNLFDPDGTFGSCFSSYFFPPPCNLNFPKTLHSFLSPKQFPLASHSITVNWRDVGQASGKMYETRGILEVSSYFEADPFLIVQVAVQQLSGNETWSADRLKGTFCLLISSN